MAEELTSQGIAKIAAQLAAMLRDDSILRQVQGGNAPQCKIFKPSFTLTTTPVQIVEALSQSQKYTLLIVMFQFTSGSGRFRIDGPQPTPAGVGFPIPAGGGQLNISGIGNIQQFWMVAETGNTLDTTYALFL